MFDPAEIQELLLDEIELITQMCRARPRSKLCPEIHNEDFNGTLNIAAGQAPDDTAKPTEDAHDKS